MESPTTQTNVKVEKFEQICEILERYNHDPGKLIPILQQAQEVFNYLPEDVLTYIAMSLKLPPARVYGVATFYAHFTLTPKGKYVVKICNGTACNVRGSMPIFEEMLKRLNLTTEQLTTDDQLFTVEMVSCLGACGLAPVVMVNEDIHGQVTPESMVEILDEIIEKESGK